MSVPEIEMSIYVCLLLAAALLVDCQKPGDKTGIFEAIPYFNVGPRPGGVGVLQDLSHARILSNEPFIISFEFPKGSGKDSKKIRSGSKRKSQRKRNRRLRPLRQTMKQDDNRADRTKRFQITPLNFQKMEVTPPLMTQIQKPNLRGLMDDREGEKVAYPTVQMRVPTVADAESAMRQWETIKDKWSSLFLAGKSVSNNEIDQDDRLKMDAKSKKMWANCQLLKLLSVPQKNPHFYKLLPSNYPALILSEEKQQKCNEIYDIIDLARDKKIIAEKIKRLEEMLKNEIRDATDGAMRRGKRSVDSEEENTLTDESLQGKSEGEIRSDRSKRTKRPRHPEEVNQEDTLAEESKRYGKVEKRPFRGRERYDRLNKKYDEETSEDDQEEVRSTVQDELTSTEVGKIMKQKEREASIFDKLVRNMKKYEETDPYDETLGLRKETNRTRNGSEQAEDGWELEDAVIQLAKIFKMLSDRNQKKKACENCTEVDLPEDPRGLQKLRASKSGCMCETECPMCENCAKCYLECRKNAAAAKLAAKSPVIGNAIGGQLEFQKSDGLKTENKMENQTYVTSSEIDPIPRSVIETPDRNINLQDRKTERMYRSKLPPTRDMVRVYFDNPENKLLVWSKRGRRTMPWEPLTSDLQLYRDRARQILKSAEDILQRIKDTEDKIHGHGHLDENETSADGGKQHKNMDDIIKQVVTEEQTKNILRNPLYHLKSATDEENEDYAGKLVKLFEKSNSEKKQTAEAMEGEVESKSSETEQEDVELENDREEGMKETQNDREGYVESVQGQIESGSVEAAVESIDMDDMKRGMDIGDDDYEDQEMESRREKPEEVNVEKETEAKVEAVEMEEGERGSEEVNAKDAESSEEVEESEMVKSEEEHLVADSQKKESGYSSESEATEKLVNLMSERERKLAGREENLFFREESSDPQVELPSPGRSEMNVISELLDPYRGIDPNLVIAKEEKTAVHQPEVEIVERKEEVGDGRKLEEDLMKDKVELSASGNEGSPGLGELVQEERFGVMHKTAILKALKDAKEEDGSGMPVQSEEGGHQKTKAAHGNDHSLETLKTHLRNGKMDSTDFATVRGLEDGKIDELIRELQEKDEFGSSTSCETTVKLCQVACGCDQSNNSTDTLDKYDIMKVFLVWLKDVQLEEIVPISV